MKFVEQKLAEIEAIAGEIREYISQEEPADVEPEVEARTILIENEDGEEVELNLDEMKLKELKKLASDLDIELSATKKDEIIEEILDALGEGEETPEDESAEEDPEEEDTAEAYGLNDLSNEDLAEILSSYGLSVKGKRQALLDRVVKGIEDGVIEFEDEEEEGEEAGEEGEVVGDDEEQESEEEAELEETIREQIENGEIKPSAMKKFLKDYFEGDPDCADCPKGCKESDLIDCYIQIQKNLIDDEGEMHEMEEPYVRNEETYCCGKALEMIEDEEDENNGDYLCTVCGSVYDYLCTVRGSVYEAE